MMRGFIVLLTCYMVSCRVQSSRNQKQTAHFDRKQQNRNVFNERDAILTKGMKVSMEELAERVVRRMEKEGVNGLRNAMLGHNSQPMWFTPGKYHMHNGRRVYHHKLDIEGTFHSDRIRRYMRKASLPKEGSTGMPAAPVRRSHWTRGENQDLSDLELVLKDDLWGAFEGLVTCEDVICDPIGLLHDLAKELTHLQQDFHHLKEEFTHIRQIVMTPLGMIPMLKGIVNIMKTLMKNMAEKPLKILDDKVQLVVHGITKVDNASISIEHVCANFKNKILNFRIYLLMAERKTGDSTVSEQVKEGLSGVTETCQTIVNSIPAIKTLLGWMGTHQGHDDDLNREEPIQGPIVNITTYRNAPVTKRPHERSFDFHTVLNVLGEAENTVAMIKSSMSWFDELEGYVEGYINRDYCISIGPFGKILGSVLGIGIKTVEGVWNAASALVSGDPQAAFDALKDVGVALGNALQNAMENLWAAAQEAAEDAREFAESALEVGERGREYMERGLEYINPSNWWSRRRKRTIRDIMINETMAKALLYSKRSFPLNGDMVYQLVDYLNDGKICINPMSAMNLAESLMSTLLKPLEMLVEEALNPLIEQLKAAMPSFPNMDILDSVKDVLNIDLPPASVFDSIQNVFSDTPVLADLQKYKEAIPVDCIDALKQFSKNTHDQALLKLVADKCSSVIS